MKTISMLISFIVPLVATCLPLAGASVVLGAELNTSATSTKKSVPAELPLISKTKVPIIFIGEVENIVSSFEDRPSVNSKLPRDSDLYVAVRVLQILKRPEDAQLSGRVFLRFGGIFALPHGLESSWNELTSAFAGRRFVFFGYDITEIRQNVYLVNSGHPISPESQDKEQDIRNYLQLRN